MAHWSHTTTYGPADTSTLTGCASDVDAIRRPPAPHAHAQALLTACLHDWGWDIETACDWIAELAAEGCLHPQ